jgi:hypothetical protein
MSDPFLLQERELAPAGPNEQIQWSSSQQDLEAQHFMRGLALAMILGALAWCAILLSASAVL